MFWVPSQLWAGRRAGGGKGMGDARAGGRGSFPGGETGPKLQRPMRTRGLPGRGNGAKTTTTSAYTRVAREGKRAQNNNDAYTRAAREGGPAAAREGRGPKSTTTNAYTTAAREGERDQKTTTQGLPGRGNGPTGKVRVGHPTKRLAPPFPSTASNGYGGCQSTTWGLCAFPRTS